MITGGSPCQNLSVAGNREGLKGSESRLFLEQVRIIKEMRESDKSNGRAGIFIRPRFCVWENVYGSLSSNGGRDFQRVLTEFARIADEDCPDVPLPEKGGWSKSGILESEMGEWSIAWRLIDSKFWGVSIHTNGRVLNIGTPQRRKRVALVADFGGTSAGEILFERKSVCGDIAEGEQAWQEAAERTRSRLNGAGQSYTLKVRGGGLNETDMESEQEREP